MHLVTKSAAAPPPQPATHGFYFRLCAVLRACWGGAVLKPQRKHMCVVETLSMGGRHRLLLVSCGGERFLVGSGAEGVGTIVRVRPESDAIRLKDAQARGAEWL